ncbi:MAG: acetyl-CoA acetyltransferase [Sphingomonadaceae bacterium]|nr:acetyl-CoA acetyltransferase [Sphingomonadaceae bacterium]
MSSNPECVPVIVGVGQLNDRPENPLEGLDSAGLMAQALRLADADAGGGWLNDAGGLAVVQQIAMPALNPCAPRVAEALGVTPERASDTDLPHGDSPVRLLDEAAGRIARGESRVELVTGGEALRTAGARAKAAAAQAGGKAKSALEQATDSVKQGYRQRYGLALPTDVYPLYENALRASLGQTLAEGQADSAAIWSLMSEVAERTPSAWLRRSVSPEEIAQPSADNRPIAHPYTKLMVANSAVNQGAGFIVTSLAEARRRGMDEARLVYVGQGAAAHEPYDFLARANYTSSPSIDVTIRETMARNGLKTEDLAHAELYSCFPCVPKLARRVLGWPLDKPVTVFGGLTFGGGPIANYMSHAIACMVEKLRNGGGKGLLFGNGGYATTNHAMLLSADPLEGAAERQDFDCQHLADELRGEVPALAKDYTGPATLETFTVHYKRDGSPRSGTVVALTPAGERVLALVPPDDSAMIERLTSGAEEPVGMAGEVVAGEDGLAFWRG